MLTWLHIGDLHAADEDDWASVEAARGIADEAATLGDAVDFVYLPGDIANHSEPEQYRRVREALTAAPQRKFALPGDHDFEPKTLDAFHAGLADYARTPHLCLDRGSRRAIFLDVVSAGTGGPDFRLDAAQRAWLHAELIDLGPNLSITGSLAIILWLTAIRREGEEVGFWRFLKVGVLVTPLALVLAIAARLLLP